MTPDDANATLYRSLTHRLSQLTDIARSAGVWRGSDASQSVDTYSMLLLESILLVDKDFSPDDHRFASAVVRADDGLAKNIARGNGTSGPRFAYEVPAFFRGI